MVLDFTAFYEQEFDRVYKATWLLARDEELAAEATQEAFARAWARWRRLSTKDWLRGWLIRTAANEVRDRSSRRHEVETSVEATMPPPTAALMDLRAALARLPARRREAMVLFYIGDLSIQAVAEVMGTSEGTVKAHLSQGREALRSDLEERG